MAVERWTMAEPIAHGTYAGPAWDAANLLDQEADRLIAEAAVLDERVSTLALVIPEKEVDLAHYRGAVGISLEVDQHRQLYFDELRGGERQLIELEELSSWFYV